MTEDWTPEKEKHLDQAITIIEGQKKNTFIPACENVLEAARCLKMILNNMPEASNYRMVPRGHGQTIDPQYYRDFHDRAHDAFSIFIDWLNKNYNMGD